MPDLNAYRHAMAQSLVRPIEGVFMITPNDSTDLPHVTRRIVVTGSGGTVVVRTVASAETNQTVTVLSGETLDWAAVRVLATGTTATGLRGEY